MTEVVGALPYQVTVVPHLAVRLSRGVEISLRLWLPSVPAGTRLPVILEAVPYRKDDRLLADDASRHGYLAGHGFACLRMDLRGTGSSTGVLADEYLLEEQQDVCEVIAWAAEQEWSNGSVGLIGMSWGGICALQVAALRPPALRTIITVNSTDDRYDNDFHYLGGSLQAVTQNSWAAAVRSLAADPPDPFHLGERWRSEWLARLASNPPFATRWTSHQLRDSYWRHGSVREDYASITVPALVVGGWADPFTDSALRLLAGLGPDSRGIVGPWGHSWAYGPWPGPAIGFLQECVRWFDTWLRQIGDGSDLSQALPRLRFFRQGAGPVRDGERAGAWFETEELSGRDTVWQLGAAPQDGGRFPQDGGRFCVLLRSQDAEPSPRPVRSQDAEPSPRPVSDAEPSPVQLVSHSSALTVGSAAGDYAPGRLPGDQAGDDALSLCFDSGVLDADLDLFGQVGVKLRVASDRPAAHVFARLTAVDPQGRSWLITRGNLNLAHVDGHDKASPVPIGELRDYELRLKHVAERVPAGFRLRLALSTSYWPWVWPSPERATITLDLGASSLVTPVFSGAERPLVRPFGAAEAAPAPELPSTSSGNPGYRVESADGVQRITEDAGASVTHYPHGLAISGEATTDWVISEDDPLSASTTTRTVSGFARDDWSVRSEVVSTMSCTATSFLIETRLTAWEGDEQVYADHTRHEVPREFT